MKYGMQICFPVLGVLALTPAIAAEVPVGLEEIVVTPPRQDSCRVS